MLKFAIVILAIIACVAAKPSLIGAPWSYTVPSAVIAAPAPIITATSSQVIARNYNGIASTPVVAPVADIPIAVKTLAAAPIAAYRTPIVAKTIVGAPLTYSSPLAYAAARALW